MASIPRKSLSSIALPAGLALALLIPSIVWVAADRSAWPWDMAWYGEVTTDLWYTLLHSPAQWPHEMLHAFSNKAPGIAWFGQAFVPLGAAIGSVEVGLLLSVLTFQMGSLLLTHNIVRRLLPDRPLIAIVAVVFMASWPLFVAMSHQYLTEAMLLFSTIYVFWIAVASPSIPPRRGIAHLVLATSLALMAKINAPMYFILPLCVSVYVLTRSFRQRSTPSGVSLPGMLLWSAGIIALAATVAWYVRNGHTALAFAKLASSSEVALDYGSKDAFINKLAYWIGMMQKSFSTPAASALLATVAAGILLTWLRNAGKRRALARCQLFTVLVPASMIHVVGVLAFLSVTVNEESRYLLALGPSLAILLLGILSLAPTRFVSISMLIVFIAQWAAVHAQSLGLVQQSPTVSPWVRRITTSNATMYEVSRIVDLTCTSQVADRYTMTGVEVDWLNYNTLSFYSAKARLGKGFRCYYVYLGHAEKDMEAAWGRLRYYDVVYFVSLDESAQNEPPDFLNKVSLPILKRVEADAQYVRTPFESELGVVVYRNLEAYPADP